MDINSLLDFYRLCDTMICDGPANLKFMVKNCGGLNILHVTSESHFVIIQLTLKLGLTAYYNNSHINFCDDTILYV